MANMTSNQRAQYERIELTRPGNEVRVRDRRPVIAFTIIALLVLGALSYATVEAIDGWAQGVVLAMIFVTTIGLIIAVNPMRRG